MMRDLAGRPLTDDELLHIVAIDGGAIVIRGLTEPELEISWRQDLTDNGEQRGMHLLFTGYDLVGVIDTLAAPDADWRARDVSSRIDLNCDAALDFDVQRCHPSRLPRLRLLPGGLDAKSTV
jgi:hypothetical protein